MGSVAMEPEDIATYATTHSIPLKNFTTICTSVTMIHSMGFFYHNNPLLYSAPLLLMQFSLATGVILLTSLLLKPLGQPIIVAQVLGGIILGPSILGRIDAFIDSFFPLRSFILLDVISSFGFMFYFFLIGVQTDPSIVKKIDRKTFAIGFVTVAIPFLLTQGWSALLKTHVNLETNLANSLPAVALAECVLTFPTIAFFLHELKIINSDFGRVAMSSSIVSGLCSLCVMTISIVAKISSGNDTYNVLSVVATGAVVALVIVLVIWPVLKWMMRRSSPVGQPMKESHVVHLLLGVMVTGLFSHATGLHTYYGPFILGLTIPAGPPVGSALVEKLDLIISWVFMPIFYAKNGLVMDLCALRLKNYTILQSTALVGAFGKFMGAFLTSLLCTKMPITDAISLGLVLNAQGFLELGLFKMLKSNMAIDNEAFVVMCTSMILITGGITPIIKRLYDPSKRYMVYKRRTVMHARPNSQLPVLVGIHNQEDVEPTINLLQALYPTERSPLAIYLLHLIELVGRANPLLIPHKLTRRPSSKASPSEQVVNAFRKYEQRNESLVTLHPFTAISPCATMHDDVCTIALDKKTSLIIVPFYKRFHARKQRMINKNVLEKAPCSVAILVHHGGLFDGSFNSRSGAMTLTCQNESCYNVAILFLGGADDREALAFGARMAAHPNINLTLVRLLVDGSITNTSEDVEENRLDSEVLSEFREGMADNYRVMYVEELVMDGSGTMAVIRSMENNYELVIAGRNQDKRSPVLSGFMDENEQSELGAIGEVLATADFMGKSRILVVQQHTKVVNDDNENHREKFREQSMTIDDVEHLQIQRR
ncbi:cation/H(+) antiporter 15-like isoform X1 [Prunus avium]|uniref:Cation/H(+) antiporter 15-like isoform X1 n=2 Tax=Prunus avium TaxID=42229 RepID=A0A6P5T7K5_PRUAV|nr:cation/H(+) antiporter 15-like isoform X1 [Prunus avium]